MGVTRGWQRFRRTGTVTARQRFESWSWASESGETMSAQAGDWEVGDLSGRSWSVRDDAFLASYVHIEGNRWQRSGVVLARPAVDGETIGSLEGPVVAAVGDWVIRGTQDEQWVVPGDAFARKYEALNPAREAGVGFDESS
jgi:hypothetical protein